MENDARLLEAVKADVGRLWKIVMVTIADTMGAIHVGPYADPDEIARVVRPVNIRKAWNYGEREGQRSVCTE